MKKCLRQMVTAMKDIRKNSASYITDSCYLLLA